MNVVLAMMYSLLRPTDARSRLTNARLSLTNARLSLTNARLSLTNARLRLTNARLRLTNARLWQTDARLRQTNARPRQDLARARPKYANLCQLSVRLMYLRPRLWVTTASRCAFCILVSLAMGCDRPTQPEAGSTPARGTEVEGLETHVRNRLTSAQARLASTAPALDDAVQAFLSDPTPETLDMARDRWRILHRRFLDTAFYLTCFGLFTDEELYAVDAWPILAGFLDYVDLYPHSGLINDLAIPMTEETLVAQHGITDPGEVSLGFHALEFLLWGRPLEDFVSVATLTPAQKADGLAPEDVSNNRRRKALSLIARRLADDLARLAYTDMPTAPSQARQAAARLLTTLQGEISLLSADDGGDHSPLAGTSATDIATRLRALRDLYAGRTAETEMSDEPLEHCITGLEGGGDAMAACSGAIDELITVFRGA